MAKHQIKYYVFKNPIFESKNKRDVEMFLSKNDSSVVIVKGKKMYIDESHEVKFKINLERISK